MAYTDITQMQTDTNRVQYENARKNLGSNRMDRDSFMQLVLAQIQFQDPTDPDADMTQMLSQQLQLEQADQMQDMTDATKFSTASNLIGKGVTMVDAPWNFETHHADSPEWDAETNTAKQLLGEVEAVSFDRQYGKALLLINGKYYDSDQVKTVIGPIVPPNNEGS